MYIMALPNQKVRQRSVIVACRFKCDFARAIRAQLAGKSMELRDRVSDHQSLATAPRRFH